MRSFFHEKAIINGYDAIRVAHRGEAVRNYEHCAAAGDFAHV
jgi:hypothetical protein